MDSEEDDHVSNDDYCSDDDDYEEDDHGNDYDELTESMNNLTTNTLKSFGNNHKEKKYTILNEYDIRKRQEDYITEVSNVLCVSKAVALILLCKFNWNVNKVTESWFADEKKVREKVGLIENTSNKQSDEKSIKNSKMICKICYFEVGCEMMHDAGCGHSFCRLCWKDYITRRINNDDDCLDLRCLNLSCNVPVGPDLIQKVVLAKDYVMYLHCLVRSYIESNDNIKMCPAEHCDYAVEYEDKVSPRGNCDVTCVCTHSFCLNCMEEAHCPVDCDTAAKWMIKRSGEAKTMNWFLANFKPCPNCEHPFEFVQSADSLVPSVNTLDRSAISDRMTCICGFVFCWSCLSAWGGSLHVCKQYSYEVNEKIRSMATRVMDAYTDQYSKKWEANESLRRKAMRELQELQAVCMKKLNGGQGMTSSQHSFITEAWQLIIECRSVLKWTYAYRYYLPEGEKKIQFFEYLQNEAESGLERLQDCAEKELEVLLRADGNGLKFDVFCGKLSNLTNVTQNVFTKLVQELENGHLVDEGSLGDCRIEVSD